MSIFRSRKQGSRTEKSIVSEWTNPTEASACCIENVKAVRFQEVVATLQVGHGSVKTIDETQKIERIVLLSAEATIWCRRERERRNTTSTQHYPRHTIRFKRQWSTLICVKEESVDIKTSKKCWHRYMASNGVEAMRAVIVESKSRISRGEGLYSH